MTEAPATVMVERIARAIFEDTWFGTWERGVKPEWVPGGNSDMQRLARDFARAALSALPAGDFAGLVERLNATKHIVVDFDMIDARATTEERLVNPDGPEAATAITSLVAEVEGLRERITAARNFLAINEPAHAERHLKAAIRARSNQDGGSD